MPRLRVYGVAFVVLWIAASKCCAAPQQQSDPKDPPTAESMPVNDHPFKLNAYANLIQVPTLVLSPSGRTLAPIPRDRFEITLDAGTPFHPTQMRMEGNDPISLSIVLDVSGHNSYFLKHFDEALSNLVPQYLHAEDEVDLYAVDCQLIETKEALPANRVALKFASDSFLSNRQLHNGTKTCARTLPLWDTLQRVASRMQNKGTRRVILLISQGMDGGSRNHFAELVQHIASAGISLFGIRDLDEMLSDPAASMTAALGIKNPTSRIVDSRISNGGESLFDIMCQRSGGVIFDVRASELAKTLQRFLTILRGRYILEYPRPGNSTAGLHQIAVAAKGMNVVIRPSGTSVPLPDPSIAADPNTVPSAPSPANYGTRRSLTPQ